MRSARLTNLYNTQFSLTNNPQSLVRRRPQDTQSALDNTSRYTVLHPDLGEDRPQHNKRISFKQDVFYTQTAQPSLKSTKQTLLSVPTVTTAQHKTNFANGAPGDSIPGAPVAHSTVAQSVPNSSRHYERPVHHALHVPERSCSRRSCVKPQAHDMGVYDTGRVPRLEVNTKQLPVASGATLRYSRGFCHGNKFLRQMLARGRDQRIRQPYTKPQYPSLNPHRLRIITLRAGSLSA